MLLTMASSLCIMMFTVPLRGIVWSGVFMLGVAIWAWRYPDTVEEHDRRKKNGEKIGWLK